MSDDSAGRHGPTEGFHRERSQPLPPERSPRSGRVTVPSPAARRRRTGLLLVSALSVLVLFASGTSWALTGWMSGALNRFDVFGGLSEEDRPEPTGGLTFLVIGSDSRDSISQEAQEDLSVGHTPGQRSDSMMLVRLNHDRDRVTVVGIPRDLWVDVPGHGPDKVNAAYGLGGPQLAVRTVESLTDVRIDHYVEVDFQGFVNVVDALGGIEVCLPEPIRDPKAQLDMAAGTHHVDGAEALAFSRTRATSRGDLDRIERQQQVLSAMLDKAMSTETLSNPAKLTDFVNSALSSVTVDEGLDTRTINDLAYQMRDLSMDSVTFTQVPLSDTEYWTPHGNVALLWDEPAARELFAAIQADKPIADPSQESGKGSEPRPGDIRVQVFNGSGAPGLGARLDGTLASSGFQVTAPAQNWSSSNVSTTQVRHGSGDRAEAEYLAEMIPGAETVEDGTLNGELQIVIGFNYTAFEAPKAEDTAPKGEPSSGGGSTAVSTARENICG
ncbi:LCP family protein required for cell wall assembly [Nocardiopsis arvandica]|uniref:LCP family protein required for cell wall assembly n=1 Tax=Nocardiopsis sinuspersici TaxID=501010 RepID=A0A7Y9X9T5_9ACTN|nr:LCP family protein [Nocardiopsis sinuspersici]NYH51834.1 LCP family protein required for cell wall assembly [Nocardiopsis sinuspersici]